MNQRRFLILTASFLLSACMLGEDYQQPTFFTQQQVEDSLALKPVQNPDKIPFHPLDFHDPTLDILLKNGIQNAPTLRNALIKLRQSRESLRIQEASLFPTVDASAKYNYVNESKNMGYMVEEDYYMAGLDMNWEIDIFGGTRRRIESAKANQTASIENLKNVYVSLVAEITNNYVQLRTTEELLKQAKNNVKIQQDMYQLTLDKYETGLTNAINLNQARYQLETTKASIPQLEYQQTALQNALALLVGELPGSLNKILAQNKKNLIQQPFRYQIDKLYELPADIIRKRPDVRVQEEQLIAQNALVGAAIAEMFPSVNLSGLLGFESLKFPKLFNHNSYSYSYVPELTTPIFHFGALYNNVQLQKSLKEEKMIAYEQSLLTAAQEIKNALVSIDKEINRNSALNQAYQKMSLAAHLTREKYQSGLIEYSQVLDAEERRINAQTELINSNGSLYQNIVTFYKSIGGEFSLNTNKNHRETEK